MEGKLLVTYASKYGATREIAQKMGEILRDTGVQTDVLPIYKVSALAPYQAVVLGSAVYVGMWQKEAGEFLKENEKALADRMVWLFSSGPTGDGDPITLLEGWWLPDELKPVAERIHPRDITVFGGFIDPQKVNFIEKAAVKNLVKKPFGDFRDWDNIIKWTTRMAETFKNS